MPNFGFHIRHGNHFSDQNVDLPDVRAAHEEATMIFGDMARDVAAQLNEMTEWRMDVSDQSGKSLFRLRLLTEPLEYLASVGSSKSCRLIRNHLCEAGETHENLVGVVDSVWSKELDYRKL
jgi:hypothetical protein